MWKQDQSTPGASSGAGAAAGVDVKPPSVPSPPPGRSGQDLGKSMIIKGELSGSEDLTLHGQMEGSVSLPAHTLTIGPQADVKADILAKAVVVAGAVTGKVLAGDRIEIRATGSVNGDVTSPRLVIADGGSLRGKVEMTR
jgi:cytoskeletal protein CcmA (bactofilin family)